MTGPAESALEEEPYRQPGRPSIFTFRDGTRVNLFNPGSAIEAEGLFQRAIAADPDLRPRVHGPGRCVRAPKRVQSLARTGFQGAERRARQALTLDDELAEAYSALGIMAANDYAWAAAEGHLRQALELNPSLARAHSDLAQSVLAPQGRLREALAENRIASEFDPTNFQNALGDSWLAILERRYDAAVERA